MLERLISTVLLHRSNCIVSSQALISTLKGLHKRPCRERKDSNIFKIFHLTFNCRFDSTHLQSRSSPIKLPITLSSPAMIAPTQTELSSSHQPVPIPSIFFHCRHRNAITTPGTIHTIIHLFQPLSASAHPRSIWQPNPVCRLRRQRLCTRRRPRRSRIRHANRQLLQRLQHRRRIGRRKASAQSSCLGALSAEEEGEGSGNGAEFEGVEWEEDGT